MDEDSNTPPDQAPGSTRPNVKTRWNYVLKRGWSPADFSKVLEKWLRVGINLAYRQEFMRFLKGKYKYDFTGDSRGPAVSRVTVHRTLKSKNKRPVGWELIAPALAMADAALDTGEIRTGRTMAAAGMANTLAKMRKELTSKNAACDLALLVCLWEMSKPYWEEAINAPKNTDYLRGRAAQRVCHVVNVRTGATVDYSYSQLERIRQRWWMYWILLQETMEEEWIWTYLNKTQ